MHTFYTLSINPLTFDINKLKDPNLNGPEVVAKYGWEAFIYWHTFIRGMENDGNGTVKINPGDIVLDLGANIGMTARFFEENGASKIYCVEPDPLLFKVLKKNKSDKWILINNSVGTANGEIILNHWEPFEDLQYKSYCLTLKHLFFTYNIDKVDFLKIDIEGAERDLLYSCDIRDFSKIKKIYMEWHRKPCESNELYKESLDKILEFLNRNGYNTCLSFENIISSIAAININI